jgi:tetratricopeptide (TPR) repeat protein
MVPIDLRALEWVACAVAFAAPAAGLAEAVSDPVAQREQGLIDRIAAEQSENGPHSLPLVESFTELGQLYEDANLKAPAAAAFEQARGVIRANYGLSSLEEAPGLEALIRVEESMGYVEEPWELEQELLGLARANPDDLRAVPIYRELGDKRMAMLDRYLAGEFPPQLVLGCYYERVETRTFTKRGPNCTSGSRSALIRAVSREAFGYYFDAVRVLNEHELYSSDELHELEGKILDICYAQKAYGCGRLSLRRSLAYDVANRESSLTRVRSLLRIADWDVLTSQARHDRADYDSVLDVYRQGYEALAGDAAERSSIDALFSPKIPIVLPSFEPNPLVTQRATSSGAYIDVAFDVTKYGHAENIEILDTTTETSREAKRTLVSTIFRSAYRPRVVDGRVADAARVVLRYYVD